MAEPLHTAPTSAAGVLETEDQLFLEQRPRHLREGEGEPLTNWPNPPTLLQLKQDFQDGQIVQKAHLSQVETWLENLNVTGKAAPKPQPGRSSIVPKLIRKQAEWRYASLSEPFLSTTDLFNVAPITWEDREAAKQNELVLNHQFRAYVDRTTFIDEYVRAAVDEGTVVLRTSWNYDSEFVDVEVPIVELVPDPSFEPVLMQALELQAQSPSQFATDIPDDLKQAIEASQTDNVPYRPVIVGTKTVQEEKVLANHPMVEVCNLRNVTIDPTCHGKIEKAQFVVFSWETSLAQLKREGRYQNLDRILIDNNSILGEPDHAGPEGALGTTSFNFNDKARKKFVIYEYWGFWDTHQNGKLTPIVAAWVGGVMVRLEENPYPDKLAPYVVVQYLPKRKSNYGEPDGALLEDNQAVAGAVTRGMIDLLGKSANGQTGLQKGLLDVTNRRKFDRGQDYEFNGPTDPRTGFFQHTYPEIPQSAQFMLALQNQEAESLTGVKSFSEGIGAQALGDVAAGIRGALDAASKRELGILRRLKAGIIAVGRKFIAMNSEFLSDEEVIRITNDQFVTVRRDDLAGKVDVDLSISTPEEDATKVERLSFILQTLGPNTDPGLVQMILSDIARLQKMPDLSQRIAEYQPQPDPLELEKAQLEVEKLRAEVSELMARATERQAGAQLDQAKAITEQVTAGNVQSDTDQKNLDFVEQQTGVAHAREMEQNQAQAKAQAQVKLIEHGLKEKELDQKLQGDQLKAFLKERELDRQERFETQRLQRDLTRDASRIAVQKARPTP